MMAWLKKAARAWLGISNDYEAIEPRLYGAINARDELQLVRLWELETKLTAQQAEIDQLRTLIQAEPAKKVFKPRGWREAMTLMEGNQ